MASTAKAAMTVLLVGSLVLIVVATTMPWAYYYVGHSHWTSVEWMPFTRRVRPGDFVLNVFLFVPFGYAALRVGGDAPGGGGGGGSRRLRNVAAAVAVGCLVSLGVEWFQVYCHGRIPTTADVIANTIGTWAGTRLARSGGTV